MTRLNELNEQELLDKLERKISHPVRPKPVAFPAFDQLVMICEGYLDDLESYCQNEDEYAEHWIFEKVMETIYGKMIWDYINSIS